jgi:hypothetical protein
MKTCLIKPEKVKFTPFVLNIKIETLEELKTLMAISSLFEGDDWENINHSNAYDFITAALKDKDSLADFVGNLLSVKQFEEFVEEYNLDKE